MFAVESLRQWYDECRRGWQNDERTAVRGSREMAERKNSTERMALAPPTASGPFEWPLGKYERPQNKQAVERRL